MNEQLFLRDPEETTLGKKIVRKASVWLMRSGLKSSLLPETGPENQHHRSQCVIILKTSTGCWSTILPGTEFIGIQAVISYQEYEQPRKENQKPHWAAPQWSAGRYLGDASTWQSLYQIAIQESNKNIPGTRLVAENNKASFTSLIKTSAAWWWRYSWPSTPLSLLAVHWPAHWSRWHISSSFKNNLPSWPISARKRITTAWGSSWILVFSSIRKRKWSPWSNLQVIVFCITDRYECPRHFTNGFDDAVGQSVYPSAANAACSSFQAFLYNGRFGQVHDLFFHIQFGEPIHFCLFVGQGYRSPLRKPVHVLDVP